MNVSNIGIKSNIYIRTSEDYRRDPEFVKRITKRELLRSIESSRFGTLSVHINLTPEQKKILDNAHCMYSKQEAAFGPMLHEGAIVWSCRCENISCVNYENCMSDRFAKRIVREPAEIVSSEPKRVLSNIGITVSESAGTYSLKKEPVECFVERAQAAEPDPIGRDSSEYIRIASPEEIISADRNTHFLLNSAPGTGKTYTIIQRIIYLLENQLCKPESIYILCYTRSAKKVVEDKINEAVAEGRLYASAKDICLFTFDSFATLFLLAVENDITEDFRDYGYNDRIKLFNKYITKEDFADVEYFIIDEIQDLVNERAEMVLSILKNLTCGYLLAGDKCQAIYDYEADKSASLDSAKFYSMLEEFLPQDSNKYEIISNRRQSENLASVSSKIRELLLKKSSLVSSSEFCGLILPFYESDCAKKYIKSLTPDTAFKRSTAVLCRTNIAAEAINTRLCKKRIPHEYIRGVNAAKSLPRWIADVFWDYCKDTIDKDRFIQRYQFRVSFGKNPEAIWSELCRICSDSGADNEIKMHDLLVKLSSVNALPDIFFDEEPKLKVSTIHKAKGSEFECVYIADSSPSLDDLNDEELRIRYVGFTRARNELHYGETWKTGRSKKTESGRQIVAYNTRKTRFDYCANIVIGLNGDIDPLSFVRGSFDNAVENQKYIAENVHIYDPLTIKRSDTRYIVVHCNHAIGMLSEKMLEEFRKAINTTGCRWNLPPVLKDVYVSRITSEILTRYDDSIPIEFASSKICYGIEITGLASVDWDKISRR